MQVKLNLWYIWEILRGFAAIVNIIPPHEYIKCFPKIHQPLSQKRLQNLAKLGLQRWRHQCQLFHDACNLAIRFIRLFPRFSENLSVSWKKYICFESQVISLPPFCPSESMNISKNTCIHSSCSTKRLYRLLYIIEH